MTKNFLSDCSKSDIKIAKTFGWIVGVFFFCNSAFALNVFVTSIAKIFDSLQTQNSMALQAFNVLSSLIANTCPATSPFIYAYRVKCIRERMKKICRASGAQTQNIGESRSQSQFLRKQKIFRMKSLTI